MILQNIGRESVVFALTPASVMNDKIKIKIKSEINRRTKFVVQLFLPVASMRKLPHSQRYWGTAQAPHSSIHLGPDHGKFLRINHRVNIRNPEQDILRNQPPYADHRDLHLRKINQPIFLSSFYPCHLDLSYNCRRNKSIPVPILCSAVMPGFPGGSSRYRRRPKMQSYMGQGEQWARLLKD